VYLDYYTMNPDLFSLEIPSLLSLEKPTQSWSLKDAHSFTRMTDGLVGVLLSIRKYPLIRYQRSSELCFKLADRISNRIKEENDFFIRNCRGRENTLLFIVDRTEDPVTPLLSQWTYQAMLHELISISNGKVVIGKKDMHEQHREEEFKESLQEREQKLKETEFVLSYESDQFYRDNMYVNFGDLATNLKELLDQFQEKNKSHKKVETIEQMKDFVEAYPEFRKLSGHVNKHVSLMSQLSLAVEKRHLFDVSSLEQDIACNEKISDHFKVLDSLF
jgi:vacuolar protein sorting-associated protein 45